MKEIILLDTQQIQLIIQRLARQLVEEHEDFKQSAIIGLQPRGVVFAERVAAEIESYAGIKVPFGTLDTTFYRDDFRMREAPLQANATKLDFSIADKKVILADDVLFTGRSVRAALDALLDYGRPAKVSFMTLIDRRFSRDIPIQADYVGQWVDSIESERVAVTWDDNHNNDTVKLYTPKV